MGRTGERKWMMKRRIGRKNEKEEEEQQDLREEKRSVLRIGERRRKGDVE